MRILSFNVYDKNPSLPLLIDFLRKEDADVVCLQEFPAKDFPRLKSLKGYHIHRAKETFIHKRSNEKSRHLLLVILSKFPIENAEAIRHLTHRTKSLRHAISTEEISVHFHFIDIIDAEGRALRVFNCHLECTTNPAERLLQFQAMAARHMRNRIPIYCGDFNTFSTPLTSPFVFWLFGYDVEHLVHHEPMRFRRLFKTLNLQNPFEKRWTFLYLPMQLDYILLPNDLRVRSARVLSETYGSDHYPIAVEF